MKNTIKQRFFLGIFLAATITATIGHSIYAYNILSFAIPILFVVVSGALFSESIRRKSIEAAKARSGSSTISNTESCVWNLSIIFLLAAFGHWFLALLWFISWLILFGIKLDAMKEINKEKEEVEC